MKNHNKIDWVKPILKFNSHFGYDCQIPLNARIENEEDFGKFSELVDKCIADDFDYTIKKYGTVPPKNFGLPEIIVN